MKLFGQIIRTIINTATLPVDVARDVVEMPWAEEEKSHTAKKLEKIKEEAKEDAE